MKLGILLQSPLGAQVAPIGSFKRSAAAVGAIASGVSNLANSLSNSYLNMKIQDSTNKMNYKIWQEQLAAQRENWKREQDNYLQNRRWQLQDIANQRNYDSPAAQKQRYLAAGINPYLANSIGQGQSVSSPPTPPSFSSPASPIPMQAASVDLGIGQGISAAAQAYYGAKNEERSDYALGADITFRDRTTRAQLLDSATKAKEAGVNAKWIDSQIEEANRNYYFNQDRFAREVEYQNMQHDIEQQKVDIENSKLEIERESLRLNIKFTQAQISSIAQQVSESKERVRQMVIKGDDESSINKYIAKQQKALADKLERENNRGKRNDIPGIRQSYQDFTEWLFTPLKGLISIGGKF